MFLKKISAGLFAPAYTSDWNENSKIEEGSVGKFIKSSLRSAEQANGYFGVIIPQIVEQLDARGQEWPTGFEKEDVVHALMHRLFLTTVDFMGVQVTISTSKMNKEEFTEFYERIAEWYSTTFLVELIMPQKEQ